MDPQRTNQGIVATASGTVTRNPLSAPGLVEGVSYAYTMPVCEAATPMDFDGSFWDPADPGDLARTAGKTGYITLMGPDTAVFRADDDSVAVLTRHSGVKGFDDCR